jgi:hypothetical protein
VLLTTIVGLDRALSVPRYTVRAESAIEEQFKYGSNRHFVGGYSPTQAEHARAWHGD